MVSATEQIPGGAHLSGIDIGHGDVASPQKGCDLFGVDFVVFAFSSVDSLHVEGMTQDERNLFFGAEISEPVPDEHALHGHDNVFSIGFDGLEECLWRGFPVPMQGCFTFLIQDTNVHGSGMKVDSAIILVLFGVESHWASSFG